MLINTESIPPISFWMSFALLCVVFAAAHSPVCCALKAGRGKITIHLRGHQPRTSRWSIFKMHQARKGRLTNSITATCTTVVCPLHARCTKLSHSQPLSLSHTFLFFWTCMFVCRARDKINSKYGY